MPPSARDCVRRVCSDATCRSSNTRVRARCTTISSTSGSMGLVRKSYAPALTACSMWRVSPMPEATITLAEGERATSLLQLRQARLHAPVGRQHQVQDHDGELPRRQRRAGAGAVAGLHHLEAGVLQERGVHATERGVIVHQQQRQGRISHGAHPPRLGPDSLPRRRPHANRRHPPEPPGAAGARGRTGANPADGVVPRCGAGADADGVDPGGESSTRSSAAPSPPGTWRRS